MLEQVCESGAPLLFILRTDVVPLVDVYDRKLPVDVENHVEAIRQRVLFELNFGDGYGFRFRGPGLGNQGKCEDECCEHQYKRVTSRTASDQTCLLHAK